MTWTWEKIVALNKLICEVSGQPHAVRYQIPITSVGETIYTLPKRIAEQHPFAEGNKRTATCIAVCLVLEGV